MSQPGECTICFKQEISKSCCSSNLTNNLCLECFDKINVYSNKTTNCKICLRVCKPQQIPGNEELDIYNKETEKATKASYALNKINQRHMREIKKCIDEGKDFISYNGIKNITRDAKRYLVESGYRRTEYGFKHESSLSMEERMKYNRKSNNNGGPTCYTICLLLVFVVILFFILAVKAVLDDIKRNGIIE